MRILRFMSAHEAIKLLDGQVIENTRMHSEISDSTSVGACFAKGIGPGAAISDQEHIYAAAKYLSGIVTMDTCLIGTTADPLPANFARSKGRYSVGMLEEICAKEYQLTDFSDWRIYTPELPDPDLPFKIIASPHWREPILTKASDQ